MKTLVEMAQEAGFEIVNGQYVFEGDHLIGEKLEALLALERARIAQRLDKLGFHDAAAEALTMAGPSQAIPPGIRARFEERKAALPKQRVWIWYSPNEGTWGVNASALKTADCAIADALARGFQVFTEGK